MCWGQLQVSLISYIMMDHEFQDKRFVVLKVRDHRSLLAQESYFPGKETKWSYLNQLAEELELELRLPDYYATVTSVMLSVVAIVGSGTEDSRVKAVFLKSKFSVLEKGLEGEVI